MSHDADADEEEEGVHTSRGKKQAGGKKQAAAGRGRAAAAAATDSMDVTEEGSEDGVGDEEEHKGRRRGLAHLRAQLHEQVRCNAAAVCVPAQG